MVVLKIVKLGRARNSGARYYRCSKKLCWKISKTAVLLVLKIISVLEINKNSDAINGNFGNASFGSFN
jgi:hypothetical protein